MSSWCYWSKITTIPFHVFGKILIQFHQTSISWFWIYINPISPNFNLKFLIDIDPILANVYFLCFYRCWSHIQESQEFIKRIFGKFQPLCFPFFECVESQGFWDFQQIKFSKKQFGMFLDLLRYPGVSKVKTNWFWESWTCHKIRNSGFLISPKWFLKVMSPK